MNPTSVSISFQEDSASEIQGTSGIKISHDLILTNGILLKSKLHRNIELLNFTTKLKINELTTIDIEPDDLRVQVMSRPTRKTEKNNDYNIIENYGAIVSIWRCPFIADTLETIFNNWSFCQNTSRKIDKLLLSSFLIIKLLNNEQNDNLKIKKTLNINNDVKKSLNNLLNICSMTIKPERGEHVVIESTPFGNTVFINSISKGIVSNMLGNEQCVMLTDANAVPGCDGGAVYVIQNKKNKLFGMVIAAMSWCRGEWVEYTLVACLTVCLSNILNRQNIISKKFINNQETKITDLLDKSVVLIRCGAEWGSGILLDRETGTILTCSHVVSEAPDKRIKVVLNNGKKSMTRKNVWAKLVYRTPNGLPYDIAVLTVDSSLIDPTLAPLTIADNDAEKGEIVIGAGYPFFSSTLPTMTRGNISHVSKCMLQTTCCVQSGSSGGPIVRTSGELLGIIVCNVITSTTLYPKLNMAVPASIIKGPINDYIKTQRVEALEALTNREKSTEAAWNFHLPSKI